MSFPRNAWVESGSENNNSVRDMFYEMASGKAENKRFKPLRMSDYQKLFSARDEGLSNFQSLYVSEINFVTKKNTSDQVTNDALRKLEDVLKVNPSWFPMNDKNLLSTGIFEGVIVEHVSESSVLKKTLKGTIKGTHYLCGCDKCKMEKELDAFEFEQHAGCDTKHPNSHIYFPNGKSVYEIVQNLKDFRGEDLYKALKILFGFCKPSHFSAQV